MTPPDDWQTLDRAIEQLTEYDWLVFTSVNGVKQFFDRLFTLNKDVRALHHIRTAAIGPATAAELLARGLNSDIVPESYRAESVVEAFKGIGIDGHRVLLPRAEQARPVLPVELTKMGARVDEITVYRTVPVTENAEQLLEVLRSGGIDLVTFTSSSTVSNFKGLLPEPEFKDLMRPVTVASIGPITSETALKLGFDVHVTAETFTIAGLVEAIVRYCTQNRSR